MDEPKRYWGIWVTEGGRFVRWSHGALIYYPSPGIAQAHMEDMLKDRPKAHAETLEVREFEVKDFVQEATIDG